MPREHKYQRAPKAVEQLVGRVLRAYYGESLVKVKPIIDCIFVRAERDNNNEPKGPALRLHGAPCAATIKATGLKDRAMGRGDVELMIDGDTWDDLSEPQKAALIDHELYHLIPRTDDAGDYLRDDLGKPLFAMRAHDYQFGWFRTIAERHGAASLEVQQAAAIRKSAGQVLFDFMQDGEKLPEMLAATGTDGQQVAAAELSLPEENEVSADHEEHKPEA